MTEPGIADSLSRDEKLEAAMFLAIEICESFPEVAGADVTGADLGDISDRPYAHLDEVEQLATILLAAGAADEDLTDSVASAIAGAGRKQFVLGGAEIVSLATAGVIALQILLARGRTSTKKTTKITKDGDKTTITINEETTYGLPSSIAGLVRRGIGGNNQPAP